LHWLLADWPTRDFATKTAYLLLTVVLGAITFLGCAVALRIEELNEVLAAVRRRLQRAR
jgi:hypothetical protein